MSGKTGRSAILEQLLADGITYMFGNPGTVEQGFLDALQDFPDITYILGLQETIPVAMADAYARATKKPAVVQLHSGVGLGNGIGMMYQAMRGHAPLVVIAGEAGIRYDAMDAQMAADLVGTARPVTKWANRVVEPSSLLRMLRRAIKIAGTPPMGPVFLCLPMDVLDAPAQEPIVPTSMPITRAAPAAEDINAAARALSNAQRPMIIVGDGVAASGAQAELAGVAELIGAEVWGADSSEVNMVDARLPSVALPRRCGPGGARGSAPVGRPPAGPATHPQWCGLLGHMFGEHSRSITSQADAILIVGTYVFPEVFPALEGVFADGAPVIQIDLDAYEIAKNFRVDLGLVADPKLTLAALALALDEAMSAEAKANAKARAQTLGRTQQEELAKQLRADEANADAVPGDGSAFMKELAARVGEDVVVFDEALTCSPELVRYLPPTRPGQYFQTRGGSLGVGFPGAIGLKLAHPDKTVIGFSGDGGCMYTIQALWTAAHHNIGAKFVVCNNAGYQLLKLNIMQYWKERDIPDHDFPACFELAEPPFGFVEIAQGFGVEATRVEAPGQISPALDRMLADDRPFLIDLVVSQEVPGHKVGCKCGM